MAAGVAPACAGPWNGGSIGLTDGHEEGKGLFGPQAPALDSTCVCRLFKWLLICK